MENEELLNEIKALRADLEDLKNVVHNDIISPIEKDYNDRKYKEATDIWREHFKDKLSPYEARLKATEGDDFDLFNASYDAWNETDADPDEWVELLIQSIDENLAPLAAAFGVPQEDLNAEVKIENGEVTDVVADTEPEETTEEEGEEKAEEEGEEEKAEEAAEEGEGAEEELSEEEQFQKELDDAYAKMAKGRGY